MVGLGGLWRQGEEALCGPSVGSVMPTVGCRLMWTKGEWLDRMHRMVVVTMMEQQGPEGGSEAVQVMLCYVITSD